MIDNPELGYTPVNLKAIRAKYGLTQKQVASITGSKTVYIVQRWEADVSAKGHSDMPHTKWLRLLEHIKQA